MESYIKRIKELEELSNEVPNAAISNLLGDESKVESYELKLNSNLLFRADTDQYAVYETVEKEHTVIQGPPGTGKSQVLSNLLAKLLIDNKSAIVVSEKRVALEVIQKKLGQFNLGHVCFIATSETISKDVLKSLKDSWTRLEKFDLKGSLFVFEGIIPYNKYLIRGEHSKLIISSDIEAIFFSNKALYQKLRSGDSISLLGRLEINSYMGKTKKQILIDDYIIN